MLIVLILILIILIILSILALKTPEKETLYMIRMSKKDYDEKLPEISDTLYFNNLWYTAAVTPQQYNVILQSNISIELLNTDVESYVEWLHQTYEIPPPTIRAEDFFSVYNSYDKILEYLKTLKYLEMPSKSLENRVIPVVKFGSDSSPLAVYIQGNIHAREWITSAALLYAIDKLTKTYKQDKIQLYIAPMVNPDGYEYSRTTSRLWRGNRNTKTCSSGVDINRNFNGFNSWKLEKCSQTYGGDKASNEPETKAIMSFIQQISKSQKLVGMIDVHNFGKLILYPPGYEGSTSVPTESALKSASTTIRDAITKECNVTYTAGNLRQLLYVANGTEQDWLYEFLTKQNNNSNPIVLTIELPPEKTSNVGFIVPTTDIKSNGEQVHTAIQTLLTIVSTLN